MPPLPTRSKGESNSDFMSRCMGSDAIKEFKTQDQRVAVCMSQSRKARHSEVALTLALTEFTEGATLVFPLIAMTEGVRQAANSDHPELIEEAEIVKAGELWDGIPLTLTHPRDGGVYFSAKEPHAEPFIIGHVTKPDVSDGKLKLQAHLDLTKLGAVENNRELDQELRDEAKILTARLRDGGQIEVSAGYFTYVEAESGIWDFEGESPQDYVGLQTAIDPDHIALLKTTQKGACSWEDGCGAPRISEKLVARLMKEMGMEKDDPKAKGKRKKKKKPMPETMAAASTCTCHTREDLRNTGGADRDGSVKPAIEEGTMGTEASGGNKDPKEPTPDPNPNPNPTPKPGEGEHDPAAGAGERKDPEATREPVAAAAKAPTWDELFAAADPDMRYSMNQAREQAKVRRTQLVTFLKANSAYSEDELKAMALEQLDKLYQTCLKVTEKAKPKREEKQPEDRKNEKDGKDYSGRGLSANANGADDEDAPFTRAPEPAFVIGSRPELLQRRGKTAEQ